MAEAALAHTDIIDEIYMLMPNKHNLLVDLGRFGQTNPKPYLRSHRRTARYHRSHGAPGLNMAETIETRGRPDHRPLPRTRGPLPISRAKRRDRFL